MSDRVSDIPDATKELVSTQQYLRQVVEINKITNNIYIHHSFYLNGFVPMSYYMCYIYIFIV